MIEYNENNPEAVSNNESENRSSNITFSLSEFEDNKADSESGSNLLFLNWIGLIEGRIENNEHTLSRLEHAELMIKLSTEDDDHILAVNEYADDIVSYYQQVESKFAPPADYMRAQEFISYQMRTILVDWLVEAHLNFKLLPETLFLTVSYIDRFLYKVQVTVANLQLVGIAATIIACKHEEVSAPDIEDLIYICDKAYNRSQIIEMEKSILNALGFELNAPTSYIFLKRFLKVANANHMMYVLSHYLLELSLLDYKMLRFSGSHIAAAVTCILCKHQKNIDNWNLLLKKYPVYTTDTLQVCMNELLKLEKEASTVKNSATFQKFAELKYEKDTETNVGEN
eukprot:gnl/TRDRNA2_/TRDRNA2_177849_c0_seq2.p2 gnl/TRDRNA2_/TRDRNA2_177849_c0~~gnl/TRDRNA2_/TRDRNA2_177849_c0_seq2.p2  ORF type:complete len:341 (-),score=10.68 gnl/TRDRNA2_/TRDRNA2_177849_c0_seq2:2716-3738(-)